MGKPALNTQTLSRRQLAVAALVAGLSPAAALAGTVSWYWLLFWSAVSCGLGWLLGCRLGCAREQTLPLRLIYGVWAVLMAARALSRGADRLEVTSGGSPRFWLLVLLAVPLLWMCWGRAAPFFRTVEILWLALAVVLGLVILFGAVRVEWQYVFAPVGGLWSAGLAAAEIFTPSLFALPYIYSNVERGKPGRGLFWMVGLGGIAVGMAVVTRGILANAARGLTLPFFIAAGLLGSSARWEGLLSVLWALPDLVLAGLVCRVWGERRWPALCAALAILLAVAGLPEKIPAEFFGAGSLLVVAVTLIFSGKGKIVVDFPQ